MILSNKEHLLEMLHSLEKRSLYTCLIVQPKGNKLYILKDRNDSLFVVLIPSRPLLKEESQQVIDLGFKEIWPNINFKLSLNRFSRNELFLFVEQIEKLFSEILKVETEWPWRIRSDSNLAVVKDLSEPLLTRQQLCERNLRKARRRRTFYAISASLIVFLSIAFLLTAFFVVVGTDLSKLIIAFLVIGISVPPIFLFLRWYLNGETRQAWIEPLLNTRNDEFFSRHGFVRKYDRYQGNIKGYRTEMWRTSIGDEIIVYHSPIGWNRVLSLPSAGWFDSHNYHWRNEFYGKKVFRYASKRKLMREAHDFVDLLIKEGIEPGLVAATDHEPTNP